MYMYRYFHRRRFLRYGVRCKSDAKGKKGRNAHNFTAELGSRDSQRTIFGSLRCSVTSPIVRQMRVTMREIKRLAL